MSDDWLKQQEAKRAQEIAEQRAELLRVKP